MYWTWKSAHRGPRKTLVTRHCFQKVRKNTKNEIVRERLGRFSPNLDGRSGWHHCTTVPNFRQIGSQGSEKRRKQNEKTQEMHSNLQEIQEKQHTNTKNAIIRERVDEITRNFHRTCTSHYRITIPKFGAIGRETRKLIQKNWGAVVFMTTAGTRLMTPTPGATFFYSGWNP